MVKEYFEFSLPKNGWVYSTIILAIILIVGAVLFTINYGSPGISSQRNLSPDQAGQKLISFLNANTNATVQMQNATEMSGIYKIDILYQNQTLPLYTTSDGKYFIQSVIPIQ